MKSGIRNIARGAAVVAVLTMLTACGGGDSGPRTYTVGGTVTGLSGSGLVLQNEGSADLPISASGAFTFATRMPSGTSYVHCKKLADFSLAGLPGRRRVGDRRTSDAVERPNSHSKEEARNIARHTQTSLLHSL
jgi:hypothetical protein